MPHPVYGPPGHQLETVKLTVRLPDQRNGRLTIIEATGETSTQRGPLWTYRETWTADETRGGMEPADVAHWLLLAALQDRPPSQEAFSRSTTPGGWEDVPLPF